MVFTNVPDLESAEKMARDLVEGKLAACVNILPQIHSYYRWQGVLEEADEITIVIKTSDNLYPQLEEAIVDLHPYDIPEILALPVIAGLPAYINWIHAETANAGKKTPGSMPSPENVDK